jgi:DNA-binding transcriptional MerR regulator
MRTLSYSPGVPELDRPLLSIGAVARQLALPPATIRTWEMRYGIVVPQRTAGGQRLYSRAQLEQLRYLKRSVDAGSRPADAHRLLAERDGADDAAELRDLLARSGIAVEPDAELDLVEPGRERPGSAVAVVARRA